MNRTGASIAFLAAVLGLLASGSGCSLFQFSQVRDAAVHRTSLREDRDKATIQPKRCHLHIVTISAPLQDQAINQTIWGVADEQAVPTDVRRNLEANGLRIGVISGALPAAIEQRLAADEARKPQAIDMLQLNGEHNDVLLAQANEASLFINIDQKILGSDYRQVKGIYRLTARHAGPGQTTLRLAPQIHHGATAQLPVADPNPSAFAVQQFIYNNRQEQETFPQLIAELTLRPNQIAVLGCRPREHSLGSFLFANALDPNGDGVGSGSRMQQLVLVSVRQSRVDEDVVQAFVEDHKFAQEKEKADAQRPSIKPNGPPSLRLFGFGKPRSADKDKAQEQDRDRDQSKENDQDQIARTERSGTETEGEGNGEAETAEDAEASQE